MSSVSTRPAFSTAVTSVERTGLLLAAVATGALVIPEKLPAPLLGTALHAGPKSVTVAVEPDVAGEPELELPDVVPKPPVLVAELLDPQAETVAARATAKPAPRTRSFMVVPFVGDRGGGSLSSGDCHNDRLVTACAVGEDAGAPSGLDPAPGVDRPDGDAVAAGRG